MHASAPTPARLLRLWEEHQDQHPVSRTLALAQLARPKWSRDQLADLPVGELDSLLVGLRERLFGPAIEATLTCPACGALLDLAVGRLTPAHPAPAEVTPAWRPATARDLLALAGERDPDRARRRLIERCAVRKHSRADAPDPELSEETLDEGARAIAAADRAADMVLAVTCPSCGTSCPAPFDIASFFWQELDAWATRLLWDISTLAAALGWSERDIVALSPRRREHYLALVRA